MSAGERRPLIEADAVNGCGCAVVVALFVVLIFADEVIRIVEAFR